jgi:two-component system copper resistance phosphate regulon response regulator CusR
MKVLIVEDEPKTGDYLKQGLTEAGFVTDLARDGWDGLHLATGGGYDLVILDVMLPGLTGWQVLEGLRHAGCNLLFPGKINGRALVTSLTSTGPQACRRRP